MIFQIRSYEILTDDTTHTETTIGLRLNGEHDSIVIPMFADTAAEMGTLLLANAAVINGFAGT